MINIFQNQLDVILVGMICILIALSTVGRWLYIRSTRIRNRLQMNYIFTNITHELLTPLTILAASVEHLRTSHPEEQQEYDLMDLNIQRTVKLLQQILETSKSQEGGLRLHVSNGDVMRHITQTARCTEPLMNNKHLKFTISCKPESMMGWIDTDKLDKIIFNLLSNAVKYTPEKGCIAIDVSTNKHYDHVIIRVSDTGSGIPKEQMKHLFRRFHDGDYRRYQTTGTGLGLALTRDLVYLHGGSIQYKTIEGQGTTFYVDLPINKEAFAPSQIDENNKLEIDMPGNNVADLPQTALNELSERTITETSDPNAPTILIVEDNRELLMLMKQLLCAHYHIQTATNGVEALETIRRQPLDLIVSDVMMPEMDGYELTTHVKQTQEYSHLPIILLTAKLQEEDRQKALTSGADSYITKPFRLGDLQLRIDNIIANRQRIHQMMQPSGDSESPTSAHLSLDQEFLQRATRCINEHLDDSDYDRDTFAADMGASASTLYNKLRSLTGMGVTAFVRDIRIKAACKLAKENHDLRVSDIAYRVGFKDPKYFATSFKKVMGAQPKEYFEKLRS